MNPSLRPVRVLRRNDAVNVGMEQQVLSPRMQDAEETDLGSKMFWIRGDFQEGFGYSAEQ